MKNGRCQNDVEQRTMDDSDEMTIDKIIRERNGEENYQILHPDSEGTAYNRARQNFPAFSIMSEAIFHWGEKNKGEICQLFDKAYSKIVHWKMNIFKVPSGRVGKQYISEIS